MDMLSRVCDSLYWMSRYLERAEHTARKLGCLIKNRGDQILAGIFKTGECRDPGQRHQFIDDELHVAQGSVVIGHDECSCVSA